MKSKISLVFGYLCTFLFPILLWLLIITPMQSRKNHLRISFRVPPAIITLSVFCAAFAGVLLLLLFLCVQKFLLKKCLLAAAVFWLAFSILTVLGVSIPFLQNIFFEIYPIAWQNEIFYFSSFVAGLYISILLYAIFKRKTLAARVNEGFRVK